MICQLASDLVLHAWMCYTVALRPVSHSVTTLPFSLEALQLHCQLLHCCLTRVTGGGGTTHGINLRGGLLMEWGRTGEKRVSMRVERRRKAKYTT